MKIFRNFESQLCIIFEDEFEESHLQRRWSNLINTRGFDKEHFQKMIDLDIQLSSFFADKIKGGSEK